MVKSGRCALFVAVVALSAAVTTPGSASALAAGDPSTNTAPSSAFVYACAHIDNTQQSDQDSCAAAAGSAFNSVWAAEGLSATFSLPSGFDTMPVPDQVVAITNVERAARGLTPVTGRSSNLDALAQQGADNDEDPGFPDPFPGTYGGSNWAGAGNSVLLDDFYWMYDDGAGSPNSLCNYPTDAECWGHRDNILYEYDSPLVMGAAVTYDTTYGTSITELFIGGDDADAGSTGTAPAASVSLSTRSVSVTTQMSGSGSRRVDATTAGAAVQLTAAVTRGARSWRVSPASCTATPANPCVFTTTFATDAGPGAHDGVLTIGSAYGDQAVALHGTQLPPDLRVGTTADVARGHRVPITATVLTAHSERRLAHARIVLESAQPQHAWRRVTAKRTNFRGVARFHPVPKSSRTKFRVLVLSPTGAVEIACRPFSTKVD